MVFRRYLSIIVVTVCLSYQGPANAGVYRMGAEPLVAWHAHPYQWVIDKDIKALNIYRGMYKQKSKNEQKYVCNECKHSWWKR